jgi:hypothetical protein
MPGRFPIPGRPVSGRGEGRVPGAGLVVGRFWRKSRAAPPPLEGRVVGRLRFKKSFSCPREGWEPNEGRPDPPADGKLGLPVEGLPVDGNVGGLLVDGLPVDGNVEGLPVDGLPVEGNVEGLPVDGRDVDGRDVGIDGLDVEGREVGIEGREDGRLIEGEREGIDRPMLEPPRLMPPPPRLRPPPPRPRCAKQISLQISDIIKPPHAKT